MATLEDFSSSDSDQDCMVNDPICEPIDDDDSDCGCNKSLLDLLKPAAKSTLARKRVREPSARKNTATSKCDVKNIKPEKRVK